MAKAYRFNDEIDQPGNQCESAYPDPVAFIEPLPRDSQQALFAQMAELLTPVFQFMSAGSRTGTMDMRTWVVLYVVRHDQLNGESIRSYAQRRGVSAARIETLVTEFRRMIPHFSSSNASPARGRRRTAPNSPPLA